MRRLLRARQVVPSLALLASGLGLAVCAEDLPFDLKPSDPPVSPTTGGGALPGNPSPLAPGRASLFSPAGDRQVFIQGLIDVDYLTRNNFTEGDSDNSDSEAFAQIRGELGARVELDERIEVKFTVAFDDRSGNKQDAFVDDAYAVLKELLNQPNLSLKVGRQPVSWNLRTDYGAFLFDSRANDADITSWDGGRLQWGIETLVFTGFGYDLPDNSLVLGAALDWQPEQGRDNGLFLTLSANWQRGAIDPATGFDGKDLYSYYGGIEAKTADGLDAWFEGALQTGNAREGGDYGGYGLTAGMDFHLRAAIPVVLGFQADWLRGDRNSGDDKVNNFQNTWEGQQDSLIVESERYGELSQDVQNSGAGLRAGKLKAEVAFDPAGRYRLKALYGYYLLDEERGSDDGLGQEIDLAFHWQYNAAGNAIISLLAGAFLPDHGFEAIAPVQPADSDAILMIAANLQVSY